MPSANLEVFSDDELTSQSGVWSQPMDSVYPVLTLPTEITSEIFIWCLPPTVPELDSEFKNGPHSSLAPLLVLWVCRKWRAIALSTPRLWTYLHLNLGEEMLESEVETLINDWFCRAASCPLTFSVRGWHRMHAYAAEVVSNAVRRYAPQLQSVCLQLESTHFRRMGLEGIGPLKFTILENLAISLPFMGDTGNARALEIFSDAPRLRQVSLAYRAVPSMFLLPYSQLLKLTCQATGDECLALILGAPFLQELTFSAYGADTSSSTVTVTHHHLHTLRLVGESGADFLALLCLPSLETLHLASDIISFPDKRNVFQLLQHSPSLRRFSTGYPITLLSVDWFSTAMPNLTEVELCGPSRPFFRDLCAMLDRAEHRYFLPHLRSLSLLNVRFGVRPAIQALWSRCTPSEEGSALESFQLTWPRGVNVDPLSESIVIALTELVEQGMSIYVGPPLE
ncbi:hypothetical protein C8F04DRAFT_1114995 [Mycena alexandri]|uniref:F-box domain-containing protein n=1 Tax=Mycena alexandri TaxID=1745969 RepID=A0AAD6SP64_9AGAR|nr:hypothetical protein C8F04DRAFT_1114995 [Mycena alexandri]